MKIGLLGTGLMGQAMAQTLLAADYSVMAYNRTAEKLDPLKEKGCAIARSAAHLISNCDCIILMLSDAPAIREVVLATESAQELSGHTIIQMGTIAPKESRELQSEIVSSGGDYLEAPVLGSVPQAQSGTLQVMVGGTQEQFDQWNAVLSAFGKPFLVGEVGKAATLKLALNQLIVSLTGAFSMSLAFAQQEGLDVEMLMSVLRESALYAPTFDKKLKRMVSHDYSNPNFPTKHLLKDTRLFLDAAKTEGLTVSALQGMETILEAALDLGLGDEDYSALFEVIQSSVSSEQ
ncbi:6-phosphogluconate dehydrogenase NAD-binding protein [Halothece sp. PCC 7418]|uniref:NAD(P)-dependent oxidoreductase n=1 Tax=Halothece sp. (strain PCC 7418) TaxID=65093 RepID=UPI0002A07ED5|nr:NAD(P)-dependent oxidoreductase [Halothece sp. PCC 7418]AFZ43304.1 6-phosphogluconate dehydrogenase NAD-binding protein [Halothece sp. PCC 7418]